MEESPLVNDHYGFQKGMTTVFFRVIGTGKSWKPSIA